MFFHSNDILSNVNSLECVSMNNQECEIRTEIINLNTNEPMFYPYSIKINKCKGSCNTINDPYAKICVSDEIKNTNVKVFNLMSRTNETRHIKWHKTCKCRCRLDASICNNKQRWNDDKCRCECKELFGILVIVSVNAINHVILEKKECRKKIIDKLTKECSKNVNENEMLYNESLDIISSSDNKTSDSCIA